MIKKLIHCSACNQVIPNYQGYELSPAQGIPWVEWSDADFAGAREFLRRHFGHKLEELLVEEASWVSEKPFHEPLRISYGLAGNSGKRFLIRRIKSALDQPASYEIVRGKMDISTGPLKIQENDLRRQISAEKGFSPRLKEKLEKFIQVFRDEIARISPEKVEEEIEGTDDGENFASAYAGLNHSRWEKILRRCLLYFDKSELNLLKKFIDENRHPPDVLSILIERKISLIPLADEEPVADPEDRKETGEERETPPILLSKKIL